MKIFKTIIVIVFIYVFWLISCFWEDQYQSCTNLFYWNSKYPDYREIIFNWTKSVKNLTIHFCKNSYSLKCADTSDWNLATDYFDASQSVFLSILCDSVWEWWNYIQNSYLKKKNFLDFWILTSETWYLEPCHTHGTMNSCDYSYNLPLIFTKIMNDFFNIKQARYFWISEINDSFSSESGANTFSIEKFPGIKLQYWLTAKWICDPDSNYYKTTCKKLKWYMVDANNLLKNTQVVDIQLLQGSLLWDCENDFDWNILYCWLLWTDSDYKFLNAVYNEYFWYNLFLTYYTYYINWYDYLDWLYAKDADRLEENLEKVSLAQDQLVKSKKAITLSFRSLSEISTSFPVHIWFLMYQEDAKQFMTQLAKIYSPIRTLSDKLRNVQVKE